MTEPEVYAALTDIYREVFGDDAIELTPATTADAIDGWDSFTHLNLIVAVEMHFGIKMRTTEIEGLTNGGDLARIVMARADAVA